MGQKKGEKKKERNKDKEIINNRYIPTIERDERRVGVEDTPKH